MDGELRRALGRVQSGLEHLPVTDIRELRDACDRVMGCGDLGERIAKAIQEHAATVQPTHENGSWDVNAALDEIGPSAPIQLSPIAQVASLVQQLGLAAYVSFDGNLVVHPAEAPAP